jgi:penicillin-binding protein 1A
MHKGVWRGKGTGGRIADERSTAVSNGIQMKAYLRIPLQLLALGGAGMVAVAAVFAGAYYYVEPDVPTSEELRNFRFPQTPLRVYSRDGFLMTEYGQKREPVSFDEIPPLLVDAVVAAEDDRFFEHSGVDLLSTARAVVNYGINFVTGSGERVAGGSTITQQTARTTNFLSRDYSAIRKFKELVLAYRIESEFTKEEILELYLNTYEFSQNSFGVAAAARTYFNKRLDELNLSEIAILAGIPYGPSIMNPYYSPENAGMRRSYVLRRLTELGKITQAEREAALEEPIIRQRFGRQSEVEADYVADMVLSFLIERFGERATSEDGLVVTTTIDSRHQAAMNASLRSTIESYDRSKGYRGPIGNFDVDSLLGSIAIEPVGATEDAFDPAAVDLEPQARDVLDTLLSDYETIIDREPAVVLSVSEDAAGIYTRSGLARLDLDAVRWANPYINENTYGPAPELVSDVLSRGDVIRVTRDEEDRLVLTQVPEVEGAMVSVDPIDGAVVALTGGYSFARSKYNRAIQAARQPGSSMKPFAYSAALELGYTPATLVNDIPIKPQYSAELETQWRPENYAGEIHGRVPLRTALVNSMNLAAIQTTIDIGPRRMIPHMRKFGLDDAALPPNATLALGSGGASPLTMASAYAVFANGGYSVSPYFIDRIETSEGEVLYDARRSVRFVCPETDDDAPGTASSRREQLISRPSELFPGLRCAERAISPQNAYLMTDILKDVITSGSGQRARALGRSDLAGKTGTTNGPVDAWFSGFNSSLVAVAWIGFDDQSLLGHSAQGGRTAIPAWIGYMEKALEGQPLRTMERPPGIVEVRINPENGLRAHDSNPNAKRELFALDNIPEREPAPYTGGSPNSSTPGSNASSRDAVESIFD